MVTARIVYAVVRVVGFHAWPDAPPAVAYLASQHRHIFTVRAEFRVKHDERDVEFHIAQGWLRDALSHWPATHGGLDFGASSCESIARAVHGKLPCQARAIEVWEDDENGARVEFA